MANKGGTTTVMDGEVLDGEVLDGEILSSDDTDTFTQQKEGVSGATAEILDDDQLGKNEDSEEVEGRYPLTPEGLQSFIKDMTVLSDKGSDDLKAKIDAAEEILQAAQENQESIDEFQSKLTDAEGDMDKIIGDAKDVKKRGLSGKVQTQLLGMDEKLRDAWPIKRIAVWGGAGAAAGLATWWLLSLPLALAGAAAGYKYNDIRWEIEKRDGFMHKFAHGTARDLADSYTETVMNTMSTLQSLEESRNYMEKVREAKEQELQMIESFLNDEKLRETEEKKIKMLEHRLPQVEEELGLLLSQIENIDANIQISKAANSSLTTDGKSTIEQITATAVTIQTSETGKKTTEALTTMRTLREKSLVAAHELTAATAAQLSEEFSQPWISKDAENRILKARKETAASTGTLALERPTRRKPSGLLAALQADQDPKKKK